MKFVEFFNVKKSRFAIDSWEFPAKKLNYHIDFLIICFTEIVFWFADCVARFFIYVFLSISRDYLHLVARKVSFGKCLINSIEL